MFSSFIGVFYPNRLKPLVVGHKHIKPSRAAHFSLKAALKPACPGLSIPPLIPYPGKSPGKQQGDV